jgi:hypothetical protein
VRVTAEVASLRPLTDRTTAWRCRRAEETRQEEEIAVLKITRTETPAEERWVLQGRLVGLWVNELRRNWKENRRGPRDRRCVVDLNDVTFIDKKGERLLRTMSKQGAQFMATGIYIKDVLQQRCTA